MRGPDDLLVFLDGFFPGRRNVGPGVCPHGATAKGLIGSTLENSIPLRVKFDSSRCRDHVSAWWVVTVPCTVAVLGVDRTGDTYSCRQVSSDRRCIATDGACCCAEGTRDLV